MKSPLRFRLPWSWQRPRTLDLTLTDPALKGFFGGFVAGAWGYLIPKENANVAAFGKVARFRLDNYATVQVLDLTLTDAALKGFSGGFTDGTWGYAVPNMYGIATYSGKVARFQLSDFSTVQVLDLTSTNAALKGFCGGFTDGTWGYVIPYNNGAYFGKVARFRLDNFSTVQVLDLTSTDAALKGFSGGFTDGTWGYVIPYYNGVYLGKMARFRLDDFSTVQVLDLTSTDAELKGFKGGFTDGTWGYVVPGYNTSLYQSKVPRFRLDDFSTVQVLDIAAAARDPTLRGFSGGFTDGVWGYLVPNNNLSYTYTLPGDEGYVGKLVRFRLGDFSKTQVLYLSAHNDALRAFDGGFSDGLYGYLVPRYNGNFYGLVTRIDLRKHGGFEIGWKSSP